MPDEVEEFLRRVAQMRAAAEAQNKGRPPRPAAPPSQRPVTPPPRPVQPEPASAPPPARLVPARTPSARLVPARSDVPLARPIEALVVEAELADAGDSMGRRVAQDLNQAAQIGEHARRLGEDLDQTDERMEAHLHQVFDHHLGRLKESSAPVEQAPITPPGQVAIGDLVSMLRSPQSIRDAIIMAEVLQRPVDRW